MRLGLDMSLTRLSGGAVAAFEPEFTETGNMAESPTWTFTKTAGGLAWDSSAYAGPFTGDMDFIYQVTVPGSDVWVGFDASSATLSNGNADACIYYSTAGNNRKFTNGAEVVLGTAYSSSTVEKLARIGDTITFYRDGVSLATWTISAATALYFMIGIAVNGSAVTLTDANEL